MYNLLHYYHNLFFPFVLCNKNVKKLIYKDNKFASSNFMSEVKFIIIIYLCLLEADIPFNERKCCNNHSKTLIWLCINLKH